MSMPGIRWFKFGAASLGFAFAVALPVSFYVPILGTLAIFLFSDIVLIGLAAILTGFAPATRAVPRMLLFMCYWIALSLVSEFPRLGEHVFPSKRHGNEGTRLLLPVTATPPPLTINISGTPQQVLTAQGFWWEILPTVNFMRPSAGESLGNTVESFDFPYTLRKRGVAVRINGEGFPRFVFRSENLGTSTWLALTYFDENHNAVASYKRRLPFPPAYPGRSFGSVELLTGSVFYFNFWRVILGFNRPVNIDQETSQFLDLIFGKAAVPATEAPMRRLVEEREEILKVPVGMTVSMVFSRLDTISRQSENEEFFFDVCGRKIVDLTFGGPEDRTTVQGLTSGIGRPAIIHSIASDDALFSYYCDVPRQRIMTFARVGERRNLGLKISVFDLKGIRQDVLVFRSPRFLGAAGTFVRPGSLEVDSSGRTRFNVLTRIPAVSKDGKEIDDDSQYRSLTFSFD